MKPCWCVHRHAPSETACPQPSNQHTQRYTEPHNFFRKASTTASCLRNRECKYGARAAKLATLFRRARGGVCARHDFTIDVSAVLDRGDLTA